MTGGSISSRFVIPRSLSHTTAGSRVYLFYFWTNHSQACPNRAGLAVIGQLYPTCRMIVLMSLVFYEMCFRALLHRQIQENSAEPSAENHMPLWAHQKTTYRQISFMQGYIFSCKQLTTRVYNFETHGIIYRCGSPRKRVSLNIQFCHKRRSCGVTFSCKLTWVCMLVVWNSNFR